MNRDFRLGFRGAVPAGIGVLVYGLFFGVLAAEKGVTAPQLAFMNTVVFSGSAQLILVGMWGEGSPHGRWLLQPPWSTSAISC